MRPAALFRSRALVVGAAGTAASLAFSWVPSLWVDEAATVSSVTRSWPDLWRMLGTIDAVHGLYYVLLKCWFAVVGYSPLTLRLPSAVAIGIAAALVVVLATRLTTPRLGLVAGIAFLLVPRVAWAGTEGRPYAMIALAAVAMTLVLVRAVDAGDRAGRDGRRRVVLWWALYWLVGTAAVTLNLYLALVVLAHGLVLRWLGASRRTALVGWLSAGVAVACCIVPLGLEIVSQSRQVSWIPAISRTTLRHVVVDAWFRSTWPFSRTALVTLPIVPVAWVLLLIGAATGLRRSRTRRARNHADLMRVALPLAVVPSGVLLVATALGLRLYAPTYATMSTPFVAMLLAVGALALWERLRRVLAAAGTARIRRGALAGVAVLLVAAVTVPGLVAVRLPHAKWDRYWPQAAAVVEHQRAAGSPGVAEGSGRDGVVYGALAGEPWADGARRAAAGYPGAYAGMRDLAVVEHAGPDGLLFDRNGDVERVVPTRLEGIDRVWYIGERDRDRLAPTVRRVLEANGFSQRTSDVTGAMRITRFERP